MKILLAVLAAVLLAAGLHAAAAPQPLLARTAAAASTRQAMPDGVDPAIVGTLVQQWEPGTKADNLDTWAVNPANDNNCTGGTEEQQTVAGTRLLYLFNTPSQCVEIQSPGFYNQGIFEARVYYRPSATPGTEGNIAGWPAFWLANQGPGGWPADGEIDIAEAMHGCDAISYHSGTLTSTGASNNLGGSCVMPTAGWHTYTLIWSGDKLEFFYDGVHVETIQNSNIVDEPEQILFSDDCDPAGTDYLGGNCNPDNSIVIQYVRVWTIR